MWQLVLLGWMNESLMKHFVSSAALVAAITEALLKLTPSSSLFSNTYPTGHSVTKEQLLEVVAPALGTNWPGDEDVKRAFRVFDSEGLGFIKVTLLKRFLVQSQLGVDDAILEQLIREHCHIDGDDLINYEEFISSVQNNSLQPTC
ncbi:Calmodulin (Fragment) [Geodia barretti]|uniref:Calmodulin n=1 Tax=Geodia barretti TaxID=519541 RepID=A0AA35TF21_GEOBA